MVKLKKSMPRFALGLMILACVAGATRAQQHPPLEFADDLTVVAKLAASRQAPIMLVFTRPDCPFCLRAKKEHLEPLRVSQNYGAKIIIREIEAANSRIALRDFDGNLTTHADFARKYEIKSVPTVIVVDARGKPLAESIVGLTSPDFYNLYLEQAIDAGRMQVR